MNSKLSIVKIDPLAPNQKIINLLREALRDAKEGVIQGIGIATARVDPDGDGGRSTESIIAHTDGWSHSTSAGVSGLWMRLNYERYAQGSTLPPPKLDENDE